MSDADDVFERLNKAFEESSRVMAKAKKTVENRKRFNMIVGAFVAVFLLIVWIMVIVGACIYGWKAGIVFAIGAFCLMSLGRVDLKDLFIYFFIRK